VAGQAGWLEVYLTASTGQLTLEVRAPSDHPAQDVHLSLTATGPTGRDVDLFPGPCGPGCYSMHVTWQRGTTVLHVQVAARRWTGGALTLAVPWPPLLRNSELFTRVIATMRRQWAILVSGQVTSGPGATVHNVFSLVRDPVHGQRALWRACPMFAACRAVTGWRSS
jgi:copper transport protein